jgi:hypothetical protein
MGFSHVCQTSDCIDNRDMIIALGAQFERSASKTPEVKLLTGPDVQWGGSNHFIRARNRLGNVLETAQLSTIRCLTLMVMPSRRILMIASVALQCCAGS